MSATPDLRTFLDELRKLDQLVEIAQSVDWNLEMGAITRYSSERGEAAVLFEKVRDSLDGLRALGIHLGVSNLPGLKHSRIALALGLPASATPGEIVAALVAGRSKPPIKPVEVPAQSLRTNVLYGEAIDINRLPLPYIHRGDGGRYLNTLGVIVMRSPDGEWTNWSIARVQAIGGNRAVGVVAPFQHIGKIHALWKERGQDMPIALCLGVDPVVLFAGGGPLPDNVDEVDFLGAYTGSPIELERAETNDLLIPVSAELVLEGSVSQSELASEGPMGEYVGFIYQGPDDRASRYVYTFDKLAYRDHAIVPFDAAGEPPEENHTVWGTMTAAESLYLLRDAGLTVTDAWAPYEAVNNWLVVSVPEAYAAEQYQPQLLKTIGDIVFHSKAGYPLKSIIVVTDDIDIHDINEIVWALVTRHRHSENGSWVFRDETIWAVSPFLGPAGEPVDKAVLNLLPPPGVRVPPRTKFEVNYPPEIKDAALRKLAGAVHDDPS